MHAGHLVHLAGLSRKYLITEDLALRETTTVGDTYGGWQSIVADTYGGWQSIVARKTMQGALGTPARPVSPPASHPASRPSLRPAVNPSLNPASQPTRETTHACRQGARIASRRPRRRVLCATAATWVTFLGPWHTCARLGAASHATTCSHAERSIEHPISHNMEQRNGMAPPSLPTVWGHPSGPLSSGTAGPPPPQAALRDEPGGTGADFFYKHVGARAKILCKPGGTGEGPPYTRASRPLTGVTGFPAGAVPGRSVALPAQAVNVYAMPSIQGVQMCHSSMCHADTCKVTVPQDPAAKHSDPAVRPSHPTVPLSDLLSYALAAWLRDGCHDAAASPATDICEAGDLGSGRTGGQVGRTPGLVVQPRPPRGDAEGAMVQWVAPWVISHFGMVSGGCTGGECTARPGLVGHFQVCPTRGALLFSDGSAVVEVLPVTSPAPIASRRPPVVELCQRTVGVSRFRLLVQSTRLAARNATRLASVASHHGSRYVERPARAGGHASKSADAGHDGAPSAASSADVSSGDRPAARLVLVLDMTSVTLLGPRRCAQGPSSGGPGGVSGGEWRTGWEPIPPCHPNHRDLLRCQSAITAPLCGMPAPIPAGSAARPRQPAAAHGDVRPSDPHPWDARLSHPMGSKRAYGHGRHCPPGEAAMPAGTWHTPGSGLRHAPTRDGCQQAGFSSRDEDDARALRRLCQGVIVLITRVKPPRVDVCPGGMPSGNPDSTLEAEGIVVFSPGDLQAVRVPTALARPAEGQAGSQPVLSSGNGPVVNCETSAGGSGSSRSVGWGEGTVANCNGGHPGRAVGPDWAHRIHAYGCNNNGGDNHGGDHGHDHRRDHGEKERAGKVQSPGRVPLSDVSNCLMLPPVPPCSRDAIQGGCCASHVLSPATCGRQHQKPRCQGDGMAPVASSGKGPEIIADACGDDAGLCAMNHPSGLYANHRSVSNRDLFETDASSEVDASAGFCHVAPRYWVAVPGMATRVLRGVLGDAAHGVTTGIRMRLPGTMEPCTGTCAGKHQRQPGSGAAPWRPGNRLGSVRRARLLFAAKDAALFWSLEPGRLYLLPSATGGAAATRSHATSAYEYRYGDHPGRTLACPVPVSLVASCQALVARAIPGLPPVQDSDPIRAHQLGSSAPPVAGREGQVDGCRDRPDRKPGGGWIRCQHKYREGLSRQNGSCGVSAGICKPYPSPRGGPCAECCPPTAEPRQQNGSLDVSGYILELPANCLESIDRWMHAAVLSQPNAPTPVLSVQQLLHCHLERPAAASIKASGHPGAAATSLPPALAATTPASETPPCRAVNRGGFTGAMLHMTGSHPTVPDALSSSPLGRDCGSVAAESGTLAAGSGSVAAERDSVAVEHGSVALLRGEQCHPDPKSATPPIHPDPNACPQANPTVSRCVPLASQSRGRHISDDALPVKVSLLQDWGPNSPFRRPVSFRGVVVAALRDPVGPPTSLVDPPVTEPLHASPQGQVNGLSRSTPDQHAYPPVLASAPPTLASGLSSTGEAMPCPPSGVPACGGPSRPHEGDCVGCQHASGGPAPAPLVAASGSQGVQDGTLCVREDGGPRTAEDGKLGSPLARTAEDGSPSARVSCVRVCGCCEVPRRPCGDAGNGMTGTGGGSGAHDEHGACAPGLKAAAAVKAMAAMGGRDGDEWEAPKLILAVRDVDSPLDTVAVYLPDPEQRPAGLLPGATVVFRHIMLYVSWPGTIYGKAVPSSTVAVESAPPGIARVLAPPLDDGDDGNDLRDSMDGVAENDGQHRRNPSDSMNGGSDRGHGGTSEAGTRCWHTRPGDHPTIAIHAASGENTPWGKVPCRQDRHGSREHTLCCLPAGMAHRHLAGDPPVGHGSQHDDMCPRCGADDDNSAKSIPGGIAPGMAPDDRAACGTTPPCVNVRNKPPPGEGLPGKPRASPPCSCILRRDGDCQDGAGEGSCQRGTWEGPCVPADVYEATSGAYPLGCSRGRITLASLPREPGACVDRRAFHIRCRVTAIHRMILHWRCAACGHHLPGTFVPSPDAGVQHDSNVRKHDKYTRARPGKACLLPLERIGWGPAADRAGWPGEWKCGGCQRGDSPIDRFVFTIDVCVVLDDGTAMADCWVDGNLAWALLGLPLPSPPSPTSERRPGESVTDAMATASTATSAAAVQSTAIHSQGHIDRPAMPIYPAPMPIHRGPVPSIHRVPEPAANLQRLPTLQALTLKYGSLVVTVTYGGGRRSCSAEVGVRDQLGHAELCELDRALKLACNGPEQVVYCHQYFRKQDTLSQGKLSPMIVAGESSASERDPQTTAPGYIGGMASVDATAGSLEVGNRADQEEATFSLYDHGGTGLSCSTVDELGHAEADDDAGDVDAVNDRAGQMYGKQAPRAKGSASGCLGNWIHLRALAVRQVSYRDELKAAILAFCPGNVLSATYCTTN
eukprot:jgi/Mesvir1/29462/Mv23037-RA.2